MQARGVRASLCYPSTSAICTWARTWLAAPGPPWKWGGGSVASAGPAPRHEFDEPVIAMLPRVLYVYWGFHSWWCSRHGGDVSSLLYATPPPSRSGPRGGVQGGAMGGGGGREGQLGGGGGSRWGN